MKHIIIFSLLLIAGASCVPMKKFKTLEADYKSLSSLNQTCTSDLASTTTSLAHCNEDKDRLAKEIIDLKEANRNLMSSITEMASLTKKEAENLENSLENLKEKDLQIKSLNEAINKKDSMTIALVTSLKRAVGADDKDIEINVEKGVVMVSISDKFLFTPGSWDVSARANEVLGKVALILQDRPTFEVLIEGHTDNVPYKKGDLIDNWDLSVKRATSLARVLAWKFKIAPERLIPAGRGHYMPIAPNTTAEGRASNRRTRIIIMPKIDEFYGMIEEGMKKK
jgi:chemotaxis protein MotB